MTGDKLFTVILDYSRGTYVTQVPAASPSDALPKWLSELNDQDLAEWKISRDELSNIVTAEGMVGLNGCLNVWCTSGSGRNGLILINLVATDRSS